MYALADGRVHVDKCVYVQVHMYACANVCVCEDICMSSAYVLKNIFRMCLSYETSYKDGAVRRATVTVVILSAILFAPTGLLDICRLDMGFTSVHFSLGV